jgi:quercetin dioxygenase-like cupin family protein
MRTEEIVAELQAAHPGKDVVSSPEGSPTTVVCRIVPASESPDVGHSVVVVSGRSEPHYHEVSHETFTVTSGEGVLYLDGDVTPLRPGDSVEVPPGQVHWVEAADEVWLLEEARPAWTPEDHFVVS